MDWRELLIKYMRLCIRMERHVFLQSEVYPEQWRELQRLGITQDEAQTLQHCAAEAARHEYGHYLTKTGLPAAND
jgi:hypothetical protein